MARVFQKNERIDEMSEQKRYTALDYKVTAENCEKLSKSFLCGDEHDRANYADMAAMLRQAADAEEENAQLKARLDAVVNECENSKWDHDNWLVSVRDATYTHNSYIDKIIRAARGEGGAE